MAIAVHNPTTIGGAIKKHMTAFTAALTLLIAPDLTADEIDIRTWTLAEAARAGSLPPSIRRT